MLLIMEASAAWLSSTRPRQALGASRILKMSLFEAVSPPIQFDQDDEMLSSVANLKLAYKSAKLSRSRRALAEALARADEVGENGFIQSVKIGHIVVSVYKLVDGGSGSYIKHALSTLSNMISLGIIPDTPIFNNVIDMCAKSKCHSGYDLALEQLDLMISIGVLPDLLTFTSLATACAKAGRWKESLTLLDDAVHRHGISPDRIMYTSVIKACASEGRWKEAMKVCATMRKRKILMDNVAYNAIITACGNAGKWDVALKVRHLMCREGFEPDHYTYTALVSAFDKGGEGERVSTLFRDMVAEVELMTNKPDIKKFTAPFNAIIKYHMGVGAIDAGLQVFATMARLGVERNKISFTTLITSLANIGDYENILRIYQETPSHEEVCLVANMAVTGSIARAALELDDEETLMSVLEQFCSTHFSTNREREKQRDALELCNNVLAKKSKEGAYEKAVQVMQLFERHGVTASEDSFAFLVLSCKMPGLWQEAMAIVETYKKSRGRGSIKVFSACISVLVEAKQWQEALSILDQMEREGVTPNEVTYNSAIEALDASSEFVRAELVFRSALRSEGVYSDWLIQPSSSKALMLDLHRLPVAVARAAVMHILGEMSQGELEIADPLIIVTGRGKHIASRYSQDKRRGLMRTSMTNFFKSLELKADSLTDNTGRLIISKDEIGKWLQAQEEDDAVKRSSGTAHGNLFLSVARAKRSKVGDVRAVCPFSLATIPPDAVLVPDSAPVRVVEKSGRSCPAQAITEPESALQAKKDKKDGCPVHTQTNIVTMFEGAKTSNRCPAHAPIEGESPTGEASIGGGGCPAHAKK